MTSILLIFLMILVSTFANHIIFEQVGEMASSVTYLHVKFEVDIQDIEDNVYEYRQLFPKLKAFLEPLYKGNIKTEMKIDTVKDWLWEIRKEKQKEINQATQEALKELDRALANRQNHTEKFLQDIQAIRNALPTVKQDQSTIRVKRAAKENNKEHSSMLIQKAAAGLSAAVVQKYVTQLTKGTSHLASKPIVQKMAKQALKTFTIRQSRGILGLGLGVLGTFMGLFNTFQIHNLKKELNEQREAHNRLVEVVQEQGDHIQQLDEAFARMKTQFDYLRSSNSLLLGNELGNIEEQIRDRINKVTHVIQVAQTRRLAIDFLPAEYLPILYQQLESQAREISHKLITKQPSDLFQLELSYFYDGSNVQLLLHVPTVPNDSILRLLKLHPFPLPLNKQYSVIPVVQDDLLAISAGFTRYSAQLSSVDLLGCHAINNVYLCERHGVLGKQLNNSCLGSLYLQEFDLAQELCTLQITPSLEVVSQLLDNWFLVFSPTPQTAYISCRNGTNNEAYIKSGITKIYLSPGCKMNLNSHLLQSDFSLHLPEDVVNFQWDWDISHIANNLEQDLTILHEAGNYKPTLKDIKDLKIKRTSTELPEIKTHKKLILKLSIMSLVALAILAILVTWCFLKDFIYPIPHVKHRVKGLLKRKAKRAMNPSNDMITLHEAGAPIYVPSLHRQISRVYPQHEPCNHDRRIASYQPQPPHRPLSMAHPPQFYPPEVMAPHNFQVVYSNRLAPRPTTPGIYSEIQTRPIPVAIDHQ